MNTSTNIQEFREINENNVAFSNIPIEFFSIVLRHFDQRYYGIMASKYIEFQRIFQCA